MTDTWHNTWDRTGQPKPWESEPTWRRWENERRKSFVETTPGEIAMPENTNNTQAAGQQRTGWGDAVEPLESYVIEQYARHGEVLNSAHGRSMARELLEVRKAQEVAAKATLAGWHQGEQLLGWIISGQVTSVTPTALAQLALELQERRQREDTGRQLDRLNLAPEALKALEAHATQPGNTANDAFAIKMVADMLRELGEYRTGQRHHPVLQPMELTGRTGGKYTVWGVASDIDYLTGLMDELGEWRSGARERSETRNQRQQAEQVANIREVLVGLGWTPPQS